MDRSADALRALAESIQNAGGEVLAIVCDVSAPDQVENALKQVIERFGRLDIAFDNARVENKAAPVHQIELAEWDRILGINLRGLIRLHEARTGTNGEAGQRSGG